MAERDFAPASARMDELTPIGPRPAIGHMPFAGHRTCEQVRHDEESKRIRRELGR